MNDPKIVIPITVGIICLIVVTLGVLFRKDIGKFKMHFLGAKVDMESSKNGNRGTNLKNVSLANENTIAVSENARLDAEGLSAGNKNVISVGVSPASQEPKKKPQG